MNELTLTIQHLQNALNNLNYIQGEGTLNYGQYNGLAATQNEIRQALKDLEALKS